MKRARLGNGLTAPTRATVTIDAPDLPYVATLELRFVKRRYRIDVLTCTPRKGGPPITTDGLRRVPVEQLLRAAVGAAPFMVATAAGTGSKVSPLAQFPYGLAEAGPTDDTLRWVARAYALAYAMGAPTLTTTAELLDVNRATLSRWVRQARAAGFLPEDLRDRPDVTGG